MATSFICKHTVEFYLVPALKKTLEREFEFVTPIYPWLSREFNAMSHTFHKNNYFRILAMFARRPKRLDNGIYITINQDLNILQEVGTRYGISVIAGTILCTNFWDLATTKDFIWFNLGCEKSFDCVIPIEKFESYSEDFRINNSKILSIVKGSKIHNIENFEFFLGKFDIDSLIHIFLAFETNLYIF